MVLKDNARSEPSEAAIAGLRQLAQDVPDTELISCNGLEACFKLPNPPQGSNGEGALVYYEGDWMAPQRFEELSGLKGKAWRRSFKVYTTFGDKEKGWLRMDMWLQQQNQGNKRGQGRVQGGAEKRPSSEQESSGDETSSSGMSTDDTSESETSSHKSGSKAQDTPPEQPAGLRQSSSEPNKQAKGVKGETGKPVPSGPSSSEAAVAAAVGATAKHTKSAPPTSPRAADEAAMRPPKSRPTRGGCAAQASGAKARAADATPSSAKDAHSVQKTSGEGGKSAREGVATGRGEAGMDASTPSQDSHGQAGNSRSAKRQGGDVETPEMKRQVRIQPNQSEIRGGGYTESPF